MNNPLTTLIDEAAINTLVSGLGTRINDDYSKILMPGESLQLLVILKGAFIFAADLCRKLTIPVEVAFVQLKSYGANTSSSGNVDLVSNLAMPKKEQHLLIVDEIVDSGRTLTFLIERLNASNPKSVKICTLLDKPSRREVKIQVDYIGTEIEDKFVVGYGLDFNEAYRNLAKICTLN